MSKKASATGTRAFLLPVEGAPVELMLSESTRNTLQHAVGGYVERVLEGRGEFGRVACYVNDRDSCAIAYNANVPTEMGLFNGPMVVVLESADGAIQSIPADVRPSRWLSLFHKKEKKEDGF